MGIRTRDPVTIDQLATLNPQLIKCLWTTNIFGRRQGQDFENLWSKNHSGCMEEYGSSFWNSQDFDNWDAVLGKGRSGNHWEEAVGIVGEILVILGETGEDESW